MAQRPGQGTVAPVALGGTPQPVTKGSGLLPTQDGSWRPDVDFAHAGGIKVTLRRISGVTKAGVLKVPFRFQGPPIEEFQRQFAAEWAAYDALTGERARPTGPRLDRFSLQTLMVDTDHPFLVWRGAYQPQLFIDELRYLMKHNVIFRLTCSHDAVWGDQWLINMPAVMTSLQPAQRPGEVGTEYVDIDFQQQLISTVERRSLPTDGGGTHDLRSGDTLYKLARRYYKQASAWRRIAHANGITRVDPGSASELAAWAKHKHKHSLRIPEVTR